jgi:PAS domain S-box-containing protein
VGEDGKIHGAVVSVHDITDRKRAEEALRASEERYRSLFDSMTEGFALHEIVTDENGQPCDYRYLEVNAAFERLTGDRRSDLIGQLKRRVTPGEDEFWIKTYGAVAQSGQSLRFEHRSSLSHRYWQVYAYSPAPGQFASLFSDITDRKRAEESLRQSEEGLRLVLEASGVGWWSLDLASGALTADDRCKALFGLPPKTEPSFALFLERLSSEDRPVAERHAAEAKDHPGVFESEFRTVRPDGSLRWLHTKGRSFHDIPGAPFLKGIVVDITDRKRVEETLRASEEHYRLFIESIPQLAWRASRDGLQVDCNRRWYEYTGQTPAQVGCFGWLAAVHPDDRAAVAERIRDATNREEPCEMEYRLRRASDGSYRWHLERAVPMKGKDGHVLSWFGCVTDIEDLKQAQELLKQAHDEQLQRHRTELAHVSRLSMMGEMAASLAHELNQPLHSVKNYAYGSLCRLRKSPEKDQELVVALEQINEEASRAAEIIRRVRGFVQKREPRFCEVYVSALVEEAILLSSVEIQQHRARIALELCDDLPPVLGDPIQVEQVIMNLVRNALEAMEDVVPDERLLGLKTMRQGGDMVQVEVSDCGKGIGAVDLEKVFEAFFTTKPEGMGMGLAISRSIIREHGGSLWVSANPVRGCTFHFTLPSGKRD